MVVNLVAHVIARGIASKVDMQGTSDTSERYPNVFDVEDV